MDVPPVVPVTPQQPPMRLQVDFKKLVERLVRKAYRLNENGEVRAQAQSKGDRHPTTTR